MKKYHWPIIICMGILVLIFSSIIFRMGVRNICVKKLHMDNYFTQSVFFDAPKLKIIPNDVKKNDNDVNSKSDKVDIDWEEKYPFTQEVILDKQKKGELGILDKGNKAIKKVKGKVDSKKKKIDDWATLYYIGNELLKSANPQYDKFINWNIMTNDGKVYENIIFLDNGYLTFKEENRSKSEMEEIAESISDFNSFLQNKNIEFLYINAGSKVNPIDKQINPIIEDLENTNERGDMLKKALSNKGITFIDMRDNMHLSGLDWYAAYYYTDHHWKTETGLWAAGELAKILNSRYGFNYDMKYFNKESYYMETYQNVFLGNQGRCVTLEKASPESFTKIIPKFDTNFDIEIPTRNLHKSGKYEETLFDSEHFEKTLKYTDEDLMKLPDTYYSSMWRNDPLGIIKNNNECNNHKKILFIQDSFAWYLTTYLACDTEEIHMIHPSLFNGSIRAYIEEYNPDMVIVILCEYNIRPIKWEEHSSTLDFR